MNWASVSRPAPPLSAARLIVCDSTAAAWASGNFVWPSRVLAASSLRCALSKSLRCWLKSLAAARSFSARRASAMADSAIARGFRSRLLQNHQIPSPSRMRKITRPICLSRSMEIRYHSMSPETRFFERGTFARSLAGLWGYGDCGSRMGEGFGTAAASPVRVWPPASSAPATRTCPHPFPPAPGIATLRRFLGTHATLRPTSCFPAPRSQPTSKQKVGSMLKLMRDSFHHLKWILLAIVAAFIIGFVYVDMVLGGANQTKQQDTRAYSARLNGDTISFLAHERALYSSEKS